MELDIDWLENCIKCGASSYTVTSNLEEFSQHFLPNGAKTCCNICSEKGYIDSMDGNAFICYED